MKKKHSNNSVVIIGGSSEIALSLTKLFQNVAKKIILSYNKNGSLYQNHENVHELYLNLKTEASIDSFVKKTNLILKKINILIFISGIISGKNLSSYNKSKIDEVINVNFSSQALLLKKLMPNLSNQSKIIFISSISAQKGSYDPIYAASKGAILSFIKSMVHQIPSGSTINAIAPSLIEDSNMYKCMKKDIILSHKNSTPSGELLKIEDLSKIIFDLCQSHWKHVNGACIDINGGQYVR